MIKKFFDSRNYFALLGSFCLHQLCNASDELAGNFQTHLSHQQKVIRKATNLFEPMRSEETESRENAQATFDIWGDYWGKIDLTTVGSYYHLSDSTNFDDSQLGHASDDFLKHLFPADLWAEIMEDKNSFSPVTDKKEGFDVSSDLKSFSTNSRNGYDMKLD